MTGQKRDAAYWRRRIEREHPEIAERLRSGDIPSVRAAAIEAGLIKNPSPLLELRRSWKKASAEERAAFIAEISLAVLASPPVLARLENRRVAMRAGVIDQGELFAERRAAANARASGGIALVPKTSRDDYASVAAEPLSHPRGAPNDSIRGGGWSTGPAAEGAASAGRIPVAAKTEIADSRVQVGQRYVKLDAGPMTWEVLSVFAGPQNMPHARIASVEEPDTVRVVSVAALVDRRRYQRV